MKDSLKKIWNIISTTLVVLMVLCAVFLMGSRLIGYECYTVISGSMEPKYMVGDLIYVKEVDVNSIYTYNLMGCDHQIFIQYKSDIIAGFNAVNINLFNVNQIANHIFWLHTA